MKRNLFGPLALACLLAARAWSLAADPFAADIRPTEPLTTEEERKSFRLPPGFEIQLVAAEPDLRKPMNMAFDAAGRLWITESREYPLPATNGAPRDTLRIFSDFDANGRARKMTVFATNLNIPIGLYPFRSPASTPNSQLPTPKDTWKCVVWSIPNIWLLEDTDGDGVADKQEILYGPFDTSRDTHGNQASFRRGFDGWLYATHGFNNRSTVKGRDGHEVVMNSGNTYRFRLDGSRIEHWTHGQVNPFGMCFDPLGNLYTADCHSSPIYQLIPGAYYPSFGAPHDGLGFAPVTIQHSHGSTAIAGIVYLSDPAWPAEFQDNIFIGNVMTSRINRDQITFHGSSPKGTEMPDFLTTGDPWFRPVDLQFGPDGALYVADFYNRIIGHYEVPLTHPGRDRERGRIWRIVPPKSARGPRALPDLTALSVNELIAELGSPNQTRRMLAMNHLVDTAANESAREALRKKTEAKQNPNQAALALWISGRLNMLADPDLTKAGQADEPMLHIQALRMIAERGRQRSIKPVREGDTLLPLSLTNFVFSSLTHPDARVQRGAAEVLGAWPSAENLPHLLRLLARIPAPDTHLRHTVKVALRDNLKQEFPKISELSESDSRAVADAALAVNAAPAAGFLLEHLQRFSESHDITAKFLRHAARFAPAADLDSLAKFAQTKFAGDVDFQLDLFKSVQEGTAQRGAALSAGGRNWGAELATKLLAPADTNAAAWSNTPLTGAADARNPWTFQERLCADGKRARLLSSFPNGETLTGVLRSAPFPLPATLSFYLCGHDGIPGQPAQKKNFVRLVDAATGQALREAAPPRNDTAQKITWNLAEFAGRRGFIEATDGDTAAAFAWLALGRFEPALPELVLVDPNQLSRRQQAAAEIAGTLKLASLEPPLVRLLRTADTEPATRAAAAKALLALKPDENFAPLAPLIGDVALTATLRDKLSLASVARDFPAARTALAEAMSVASHAAQVKLALALAASAPGAESLLQLVSDGKASARLLLEKPVRDKLLAANPPDGAARVAQLTRGLAPVAGELQKLIDQRARDFSSAKTEVARGAEIFARICAVCHQLEGRGNLIGPQLDGIGNRGLERLCEDILDPNRNVDRAFRASTVQLNDGDVITGLVRREEGELLVLADATGREISVAKKQIKQRRESESSLMPDNFGEAMAAPDFYHLLAYLLSQRGQSTGR